MRLRQFRLAVYPEELEFISFDSSEGQNLLRELLAFACEVIEANDPKAYPLSNKVELFYLFGSLDSYLNSIEPDLQDVVTKLDDLRLGLMTARKLSYKIQKELGLKDDAGK